MYQPRIRISMLQDVSKSAGNCRRKSRTWNGASSAERLLRPDTIKASVPLAERNGVHQAAFAPQRIRTTIQHQAAGFADVSFVAFAVIADLFDDVKSPVVVESHEFAEVAGFAEQALHRSVAGCREHLIDVGRGYAIFLSF